MGADAQFGYAKADATAAVVTKVVLKIVVQVIGLVDVAIDNQLQVVPDAAARCVDATVVVKLGYKIRCGVYLVAVFKGFRVQIGINRRTDGVGLCCATAYQLKALVFTMGRTGLVGIDRIQGHQPVTIGIADILGDGKCKVEDALAYVFRTAIQVVGAVAIHKGLVGTGARLVVQPTGDGFFGIAYR